MLRRGNSLLSTLLKSRGTNVPNAPVGARSEVRTTSGSLLDDPDDREGETQRTLPASPPAGVGANASSPEPIRDFDEFGALPGGAAANERSLASFDADLLRLIQLTHSTLTRAIAAQTSGRAGSALEPVQKGLELAERVEQRGRGLLVETSLTAEQRPRVSCAAQNAQDQSVALRAVRSAWQTCAILAGTAGSAGTFARVKRLAGSVAELNATLAAVFESGQGTEKQAAAEVAARYRAVLTEQREILTLLRGDSTAPPLARRVGRAAVLSLVIAGESMTRVAARRAYPESAGTSVAPKRPDINDGILRPLPLR